MNDDRGRREIVKTAVAALMATCLTGNAFAQGFPNKSIRIINPFPPGGAFDLVLRSVVAKMGGIMNGSFYVENIPGAAGTIGSDRVAKSTPDGYTILLSNNASQAVAPSIYPKLPYNPLSDFEHIGLIGSLPNVLLVGPQVKATNFQQFLVEARERSNSADPMSFGSGGNGSSLHLCGEYFRYRSGIKALHVPYKGNAPALIALMGGETSFQFDNISTAIAQSRSGKLRALAITSATRAVPLPDIPTMEELGYKDFVLGSWIGLSAPAHTPSQVIGDLSRALAATLADAEIVAQLKGLGVQLPNFPPSGYRDFVQSEIKRWGDLVRQTGAKLD